MNRFISKAVIVLCLLLLSGCASSTLNSVEKNGATKLTNEDIYSLVTSNTLRLISSEFDAYTFFSPDGSLSASSIFNYNLDYGSWDIKSDEKLCIKYSVWYYGDINCYTVYLNDAGDEYYLFTTNGSLAFTATASTGNSERLTLKTKKDKKDVFVRSDMGQGQRDSSYRPAPSSTPTPVPAPAPAPVLSPTGPGASVEEITHTVKSMAKDCPGCNFEEADLRQANLVGANLKGANLQGADLSRANLRRANLEGSDLRGATLLSTNLPGANLKEADLTGADLTGSNLIRADFTDADLSNTILENTLQEGVKGLK